MDLREIGWGCVGSGNAKKVGLQINTTKTKVLTQTRAILRLM
jgi:hypothetical protein